MYMSDAYHLGGGGRGGWNRKSKSHDLRVRFLQAGSFWLPRQDFCWAVSQDLDTSGQYRCDI